MRLYTCFYNKEFLYRITDAYTYTFALQTRRDKLSLMASQLSKEVGMSPRIQH